MKNIVVMLTVCFLLMAFTALSHAVLAETPFDYYTSFEPDESPAFTVGPLPQNGWTASGSAQINNTEVYSGNQSLEISPETIVDKPLNAEGRSIVWLEGWYNTSPEPEFPDLNLLEAGSSLVLFHSAEGISCLDGDGNGDGTWVSTGIEVDPTQWYRITLRQDYASQTWTCFVNGRLKAEGLGFKDNITYLSGFRLQQGQNHSGRLDEFAVQTNPLIPPFGTNELFRFAAQWRKEIGEGPLSETEFNQLNRHRNNRIDEHDLLEVLKAWRWDSN